MDGGGATGGASIGGGSIGGDHSSVPARAPNTPPSSAGESENTLNGIMHSPAPENGTRNIGSRHGRKPSKTSTVRGRASLSPYDQSGPIEKVESRTETIRMIKRKSYNLDDYFSGPLDPNRHSRLPYWMRIHGSIMPKLIIPVLFVAGWSTMITVISERVHSLAVDSLLLTVLGFVVGLALSFRVSSANDRYIQGRQYWSQLILHGRILAHHIWVTGKENPGTEKEDLLNKLSAINLINAFAVATKHKLRHELEYDWGDLKPVVENLDTFAKKAHPGDKPVQETNSAASSLKTWSEYLGITFFMSNPREAYKIDIRAGKHHGNLPFEIFNYIGGYLDSAFESHRYNNGPLQGAAYASLSSMLDAYNGCERVLDTPLPLAYNIAISQITWLYVLVLPFQLYQNLKYIAIPGTIVAAYIILGLAAIGREIEDPFGHDVNDLHLDRYCEQLQTDLNILTSQPAANPQNFMDNELCKPLYPLSVNSYRSWGSRSIKDIRNSLKQRVDHRAAKGDTRVASEKIKQTV